MLSRKIINAIRKINSNAQFGLSGNTWEETNITWTNNTTPISKADIEAQFPQVELDMAIENLRAKRNKLLQDTDYIVTMNLEAGNTVPAEWVTYRQSLRDLTNGLTTVEQVNAVVYPTKPE